MTASGPPPAPPAAVGDPALARYHRFVLLPVFGIIPVLGARRRATSDEARADLTGALRCQIGGAAVWLLHAGLQAAILIVNWMVGASAATSPELERAAGTILVVGTILNIIMWVFEWALAVLAGLRAANGHPYPLSRRARRKAASPIATAQKQWKSLNDG